MASGVGAGVGADAKTGSGGGAGGNTRGKIASEVGAGEAGEIATSGGSGTAAVGNTIRSGTGTNADAGAAVGSCPGAGLDAYREITSAGAAGADEGGIIRSGAGSGADVRCRRPSRRFLMKEKITVRDSVEWVTMGGSKEEADMKGMLKGPLIIAAILVVVRVVLERAGAPGWLNNFFSVVVLYVFIAPLYFAFRIANSGVDRPYRTLFRKIALFTALARSMVITTYWLAYHYQWTELRFSVAAGGNVG